MKKIFFLCSKCKKPIIARAENGLWHLQFGKSPLEGGNPPIDMIVHGSIKMRCWRHSCRSKYPDHWNVFNFLPFDDRIGLAEAKSGDSRISEEKD